MADRLFLDANILYSAARSETAGLRALWDLVDARLISSQYAVAEATRNLDSADSRDRLTELLRELLIIGTNPAAGSIPDNIDLPSKDRPILLTAIQAGSSHLLTGDKRHFGRYFGQVVAGVKIMLPAVYIRERVRSS